MEIRRYRPHIDKFYFWIEIAAALTVLVPLLMTVVMRSLGGLIVMGATAIFTAYFLLSPHFGYAELRENVLFIRFGFILKREIPYAKIRAVEKKYSVISDSMLSLKYAKHHVNVRFGSFDFYSLSLKNEEEFEVELKKRCGIPQE